MCTLTSDTKNVQQLLMKIINFFAFSNNLDRKKLKSTSRYIYQTLFLKGENSDIRICALGQEWNLHKVYLCQVLDRLIDG